MTIEEVMPFLLIFNTIINVSILWYVICISSDIRKNHFSLESMLSFIYQSVLSRFDEMISKKARNNND